MTTPERLRHRQLIQGAVLILLAVFTILQAIYFQISNNGQQACFERKFNEFSHIASVRGDLAEKETRATERVLNVYAKAAGLVKDQPDQRLTPTQRRKYTAELVIALGKYQKITERVQEDRMNHPVPPYPLGSCGD